MKQRTVQVYRLPGRNVHENLAIEEWWLDHRPPGGCVLLFHVNDLAVVIGRHQNPWKETDPAAVAAQDGILARRITGGGTVVHDQGNLNAAFIVDRGSYRREHIFSVLIAALRDCGIDAEVDLRNSLTAGGEKVSGNAFAYRGQSVLHHCTFLVSSDLDRLRILLQPGLQGIETRAVDSIRSPVTNLNALNAALRREHIEDALLRNWKQLSCLQDVEQRGNPPYAEGEVEAIIRKRSSEDWLYGMTPDFSFTASGPSGPCRVKVRRGLIESIEPLGAMSADGKDCGKLNAVMAGCPFHEYAAVSRLQPPT